MAIDRELDAAVPNWREINNDPRFHQWLLLPDLLSGVIRDRLLKDAARAGDAQRLIRFFRGFLEQAPANSALQRAPRTPSGQRIYDRAEITRMWERRRKGLISDKAWAQWEFELCRASAEGRVRGALDADGVPVSR